MTSLSVYQCPSDGNQQPCILYDSTFSTPIATVAHANYAAVCGWEECFMNAGGNPQPFYINTSDPNDTPDGDPTDGISGMRRGLYVWPGRRRPVLSQQSQSHRQRH